MTRSARRGVEVVGGVVKQRAGDLSGLLSASTTLPTVGETLCGEGRDAESRPMDLEGFLIRDSCCRVSLESEGALNTRLTLMR